VEPPQRQQAPCSWLRHLSINCAPCLRARLLLPLRLGLQGSIDPARRDYAAAFAAAAHPAVLAALATHNESLLLVGTWKGADLGVPRPLKPFVTVAANLDYQVGQCCWCLHWHCRRRRVGRGCSGGGSVGVAGQPCQQAQAAGHYLPLPQPHSPL
jgi:hypothetical protein